MQRRNFITVLAGVVCAEWCHAETSDAEPPTRPHHTVSIRQLQQAVAQRFPMRFPIPGVLNLDVQVPQLQLLPSENRVRAEMALDAAGPALQRSHKGTFEVSFALRYEASDHSIRAHQLHFKRLQFPTLQPAVVEMLNTYGPALAQQTLMEVVLYQMQPQDLALADVMGMQPGSIAVTDAGLEIGFVLKNL